MDSTGAVKGKLKKKIKRSSIVKSKSPLMEDVVLQILPTLADRESTGFLIAEEEIVKIEEAAAKAVKQSREHNEYGR